MTLASWKVFEMQEKLLYTPVRYNIRVCCNIAAFLVYMCTNYRVFLFNQWPAICYNGWIYVATTTTKKCCVNCRSDVNTLCLLLFHDLTVGLMFIFPSWPWLDQMRAYYLSHQSKNRSTGIIVPYIVKRSCKNNQHFIYTLNRKHRLVPCCIIAEWCQMSIEFFQHVIKCNMHASMASSLWCKTELVWKEWHDIVFKI